jgi:hypothetical protein
MAASQPRKLAELGVIDQDQYKEDQVEVLTRMVKKREELRTMLRALDDTLVDLGYIKERTR